MMFYTTAVNGVFAFLIAGGILFTRDGVTKDVYKRQVTVLARVIEPLLTVPMIDAMSMVGSMLIFCVGVNIMFPVKIKVANMLPALVFAVLYVGLGF